MCAPSNRALFLLGVLNHPSGWAPITAPTGVQPQRSAVSAHRSGIPPYLHTGISCYDRRTARLRVESASSPPSGPQTLHRSGQIFGVSEYY
ncbi:hypothetical protein NDU88_002649 [Pleurodeles waltl]|uniref:Secreted protein n=1 Tax=Pleurodeles waltl TaxID=8319 RepID=A0AAV7VF00_PLEWA|nr:hypothetical protein NDU88_002649 [Pleurodeles waltl]